jgi:hypothetical protein
MNCELKAAVTVAEMARMVGLSRSRFYQLIGKTFPKPSRDEQGRPFYAEDQQQVCLEVRRRNCGINGKPILFYAARTGSAAASQRRQPQKLKPSSQSIHTDVIEAVRALGLVSVTAAQVDQAIRNNFPNGTAGVNSGEVIRKVFLSIKRENSSENVGR